MGVRQQATAAAQVTPLDKLNESPLPIPTPSGSKKDYPAKISGLVEQISGLTLVEVADFNGTFESVFPFAWTTNHIFTLILEFFRVHVLVD